MKQVQEEHLCRDIRRIALALEKIAKTLSSAKSEVQPEQQWIPVSERLPVEEGDYLTTTIHRNVFCDYWNGLNFNRTEMVIAWMSLPEPYQRGENDEK